VLAIVIPYYNFKYFNNTLDSLAKQTDKRFNVYIGDDASSVNPLTLLNTYQDKFNFIYKRFSTNLGGTSLVKQWERCIALSDNEEWLMILGDDDVLDVNCVASFYKSLEKIKEYNCNVVRFASRYVDKDGISLANYKDYLHPKIELATNSYYQHFLGESRSSLSEYLFKRECYQKYQFYDFPLAWHSDDKAWLDYTQCGELYTINEAVVNVRLSNDNISGRSDNLALKNKARYLFFEDVVFNKLLHFKRYQKITLLLEFGILIKKQHKINLKNTLYVIFQFIKIGAFYSLLKFLRRMFIAKFKNKN